MNAQELLQGYAEGWRDFSGANLTDANLDLALSHFKNHAGHTFMGGGQE